MAKLRHGEMNQALTLRLPDDLYDELRAVAEREDRTIAGILRSAARQFLADHDVTRRSA